MKVTNYDKEFNAWWRRTHQSMAADDRQMARWADDYKLALEVWIQAASATEERLSRDYKDIDQVLCLTKDLAAARAALIALYDWYDWYANAEADLCQKWRGCAPNADHETPKCPFCLLTDEAKKIYAAGGPR